MLDKFVINSDPDAGARRLRHQDSGTDDGCCSQHRAALSAQHAQQGSLCRHTGGKTACAHFQPDQLP